MIQFKDNGNKKISYLYSYLTILVIPLVICIAIHLLSVFTLREQAVSLQLMAQQNIVEIMDKTIQQIDEIAVNIFLDDDIKSLAQLDAEELISRDIMNLIRARKRIYSYTSNQQIKLDYFILFPGNNIVFDGSCMRRNLQVWYQNKLNIKDTDYNQWLSLLTQSNKNSVLPLREVVINGVASKVMMYIAPSYTSIGAGNAYAVFMFNKIDLSNIVKISGDYSTQYIIDQYGNVVFYHGDVLSNDILGSISAGGSPQGSIALKNATAVYTVSPLNGWVYVSIMSDAELLGSVSIFTYVITCLTVLAIIVGLVLAWLSSGKVASGVNILANQNSDLQQSLKTQNDQFSSLYIEYILMGRIEEDSIEFVQTSLELTPFMDPPGGMSISLLTCDIQSSPGVKFSDEINEACLKLLEKIADENVTYILHPRNEHELILITSHKSDPDMHIVWLKSFLNMLISQNEILVIGVGGPNAGLREIHQGFRQAKYAASYLSVVQTGERVCWARDIPQNITGFLYPIGTEISLVNAIRIGDSKAAEEIFNQLYYDNFQTNQISVQMQRCLLYDVFCTYVKCVPIEKLSTKNDILELIGFIIEDTEYNCAKAFRSMRGYILSDISAAGLLRPIDARINEMLDYIHVNYALSSLDVLHMAERFNVSENYFSHFFRKKVGERFGEHLEKFRVSKSQQFLLNTDLPIAQIADAVGYENVYTFRRAFKRVTGVTPSEFRETRVLAANTVMITSQTPSQ